MRSAAAAQLESWLHEQRLRQSDLAELMRASGDRRLEGVSQTTVSRWTSGTCLPCWPAMLWLRDRAGIALDSWAEEWRPSPVDYAFGAYALR